MRFACSESYGNCLAISTITIGENNDANVDKKKLWTRFIIYSLGITLTYSAFGGLLGLQSSFNVADNVGSTTTAILYGTCVISSITILPLLFRTIGARKCLIASVTSYAIFTMANFRPEIAVMIPASIVVGFGDGILWSTVSIYVTFFARKFEEINNDGRGVKATLFGYFFAMYQLSKIVGNAVNYIVFQAFCVGEGCGNLNSTSILDRTVTHCGANDCQDPDQIQDDLARYVPDDVVRYIILGSMLVMYLTAIILYIIFLPRVSATADDDEEKKTEIGSNKMTVVQKLSFVWTTFKDTLRRIFAFRQLLITPGIFYGGSDSGLLDSEMTRAFTSCIFGVSMVPVHLMIYGVSAAVVCTLCGKLSKYIPALVIIVFGAIVDVVIYTAYLLWTPNSSNQWYIIPAYIFAGGVQGIWKSQSMGMQTKVFPDDVDVGSVVWCFWWSLGIGLQFAISPLLCVNVKIITHLALLGISLIGYVASELLSWRSKKSSAVAGNINQEDKVTVFTLTGLS